RGFRQRFAAVVNNWWGIMRQRKRLTAFTAGSARGGIIFPFVVASPRYFRGVLPLGGHPPQRSPLGQRQGAPSDLGAADTESAAWRAGVERLAGFGRAIERAHSEAAVDGIHRSQQDGAAVGLKHVDLVLPGGRPLMEGVDLDFRRGDNALISGPTGSGKSTLFRAIAGIWPFGRGEISMPAHGRALFLPQKPYLPIGTLREVVSYPNLPGGVDDATLREMLEAVGLAELGGRLYAHRP